MIATEDDTAVFSSVEAPRLHLHLLNPHIDEALQAPRNTRE